MHTLEVQQGLKRFAYWVGNMNKEPKVDYIKMI